VSYDAIIVGGGIVGATCARYLSCAGLHVALIDRGQLGGGTTGRSFGWINGASKTSNEDYHRLNAYGVDLYGDLAVELGADAMAMNTAGGLAVVSGPGSAEFNGQRRQAEILQNFGYDCRWVGHDELSELEPCIDFAPDAEAMLTPADKVLDAPEFTRLMAAQTSGDVFENCTVQALLSDVQGAVSGVATDQGTLNAPRVILACGPDTAQVLSDLTGYDGFAARFPVGKVPGLILTTPKVPNGLVRHVVYTSTRDEVHFLPDIAGGLRIGSDDIDGLLTLDQTPARMRELATTLLDKARTYLPGLTFDADACDFGIGVRAYPEDGITIAGAMPGAAGLYVVATHSGVTLAPALGKLMTKLVVSGAMPRMLRPFGLGRLPGFG